MLHDFAASLQAERRTEEASQEGGERADAPDQDMDQAGSSPSQLCTALCSALKWLVVNEELCTEFAAEGGLPLITQVQRFALPCTAPRVCCWVPMLCMQLYAC